MSNDPHSDVHPLVAARLRQARQRYTTARRDLVDLLLEVGRPLTIPELLEAGATQAQSSLYRNLATFEQCGVVRRLATAQDVARYELDEELTGHHHHLVCSLCGRIDDITLSEDFEATLHAGADEVGSTLGYELDTHRLELVGRCATCR
ncbi:MAG TPA: Fur family transcriptional regulator [Nitriliruptoraceae bacterium]|nr:Fur family transcriptional regulator [Nitriliruptoraceae bacterium]